MGLNTDYGNSLSSNLGNVNHNSYNPLSMQTDFLTQRESLMALEPLTFAVVPTTNTFIAEKNPIDSRFDGIYDLKNNNIAGMVIGIVAKENKSYSSGYEVADHVSGQTTLVVVDIETGTKDYVPLDLGPKKEEGGSPGMDLVNTINEKYPDLEVLITGQTLSYQRFDKARNETAQPGTDIDDVIKGYTGRVDAEAITAIIAEGISEGYRGEELTGYIKTRLAEESGEDESNAENAGEDRDNSNEVYESKVSESHDNQGNDSEEGSSNEEASDNNSEAESGGEGENA